jgi:hypothetical protein
MYSSTYRFEGIRLGILGKESRRPGAEEKKGEDK